MMNLILFGKKILTWKEAKVKKSSNEKREREISRLFRNFRARRFSEMPMLWCEKMGNENEGIFFWGNGLLTVDGFDMG